MAREGHCPFCIKTESSGQYAAVSKCTAADGLDPVWRTTGNGRNTGSCRPRSCCSSSRTSRSLRARRGRNCRPGLGPSFAPRQRQFPLSAVAQNLKCLVTFSARMGPEPSRSGRTTVDISPVWASIDFDSPASCSLLSHDSLHRRTDLLRTTFPSAPPSTAPAPSAVGSFIFNSLLPGSTHSTTVP